MLLETCSARMASMHKKNTERKKKALRNKKRDKKDSKLITGVIMTTAKGLGFIESHLFKNDIRIEEGFLNRALDGDLVEVEIRKYGSTPTGEVVNILKRARTEFVGTVTQKNDQYFVSPDSRKIYVGITIPKEKVSGAFTGDRVLVKITEWKDSENNPRGEIVRIIGKSGDNNAEMEAIVLENGFEMTYPENLVKEAEEIRRNSKPIPIEEIKKRKDFRGVTTFTIDPIDAKDFDDAISIKYLSSNKIEIGVHIADVSHYVTENSPLDKEALKRACSIYLVDRTIPMLPHALSNDLCSLNPGEDKLAFSAVFIIEKNDSFFEIKERWFGKTVIHSTKRFTYEEAQKTLENVAEKWHDELETLNDIAKQFRAEKIKQGAIDFETDEVKFILDEKGKPIKAYKKERLDTHKLVEEFMLLANREVAEKIYKMSKGGFVKPFIYRIHDLPDPQKIAELAVFVKALGHDLTIGKKGVTAKDVSALLKSVAGDPNETLIKTATLRSMAKAIYSTQNTGHFGLAFEYYTHFTSPIRRYPDLLVHRFLEKHLASGKIKQGEILQLEKMAEHATKREIKASEAERNSIKLKQVEFMSNKIGQTFEGTISGVTEWGIYIEEKETKSEGMVKLRDLEDYFILDQKNYALVGEKTKKRYSLGDSVKFQVVSADPLKRTLDFKITN